MRKCLVGFAAILGVCLWAQTTTTEKVDLGLLHRIKTEAFAGRSKVMDTAFYLTDVYGPRLTGSPQAKQAGDWAVKTLGEWGLSNVHMEGWAFPGAGWSCTRFAAMMKEPEFQPIIGFAQPWSLGTNGAVSGQAILAVIAGADDLEKYKGKLKGKIVLTAAPHASEMVANPYLHRLTDAELAAAEISPDPTSGNPASLPLGFPTRAPAAGGGGRGAAPGGRGAAGAPGGRGGQNNFRAQLIKFYKDEGVLALVSPGNGPDGGTVVGQGSQTTEENAPPASIVITNEHYNRITRLLDHNIPVTLEFDIQAKFTPPADSFNIVADLPGTDPNSGMVMLGGHFDSWTGGTGATDNAAGSAVAMEAIRILKTLDLKMPRTVRLALWTGEEQGTLGSRAYVRDHIAGADGVAKPEQAKISAYYNLDNGSGKIRGMYMQDNDAVRPIFEAWVAPLKDLGADALTIRATGSTDHVNFDNAGVPGFQFIQDPLEYSTRTHHSNMDVYDRLQVNDLEEASAVLAWFVYNTAVRPEMLPRKPARQPGAGRGGRG